MLLDAMAAAGIVFKRRPSSGGRPVARPNSAKPTAGGGRPGSAKPAAAADASSQPPSLIALTEPYPSDAEAYAELLAPAACDWGMTDTAPLVPKRSPPRPGSGHHSKRPGSAAVSKTSGLEVPMGPLETKATEMLRRGTRCCARCSRRRRCSAAAVTSRSRRSAYGKSVFMGVVAIIVRRPDRPQSRLHSALAVAAARISTRRSARRPVQGAFVPAPRLARSIRHSSQ